MSLGISAYTHYIPHLNSSKANGPPIGDRLNLSVYGYDAINAGYLILCNGATDNISIFPDNKEGKQNRNVPRLQFL
jgi:hypothetical protein